MNGKKISATLCLMVAALTLSACVARSAGETDPSRAADEQARGREQLIRAFDAGWIRFIATGEDNKILMTEPPNHPGAAAGYVVKLADCLPSPELAEFPEKPVGLLKQILETGKIRKLVQAVPNTPADTSYYFTGVSQKYLDGVLGEIEAHYGVTLEVEEVAAKPGRLPSTSYLLDNEVDFVDQLNATGGVTQGMRRRISRRFTCTMSASSQFIHIPNDAPLAKEINTWADLVERPDLRICAGPLTTQTARAFLPNNQVKTIYINDLTGCITQIEKGKADLMINPLPNLEIADIQGYKSVHTMLVAGTPLWVALEGIQCPSDGDPKTEDECFETSPP
jgi:ABC-type amino acid transport substrate-binding protein